MRDYRVTGPESDRAVARGLADGAWFQAEIAPARLQQLMVRTNARAAVDTFLWVGLLILTGWLAWKLRTSWWAVPMFLLYGGLHGGSADPRWHECGHGTAFASEWMNTAVYYPASFMIARLPTQWRWSHFRHHTDTIIVGRDAEILYPRPPTWRGVILSFTNWVAGPQAMLAVVQQAVTGKLSDANREIVPASDHRRLVTEARAFTLIWTVVIAACAATQTLWPLLYVGGPTIYGAWLMVFFGITQHAGLQEDVLDHRLSTRSVRVNPIFGFLYLNMNWHVEHHMFPAVPYHALPALHAEIADQLAPPSRSMLHAYREIFGALRRQRRDPFWELPRSVPDVPGRRRRVEQAFAWPDPDGTADPWLDLGVPRPAKGQMAAVDDVLLICMDDGSAYGELVAISRWCTHQRGEQAVDLADGVLLGDEIECPRHNGRFDVRSGQPTRRPVTEPIDRWMVESRETRVRIRPSVDIR